MAAKIDHSSTHSNAELAALLKAFLVDATASKAAVDSLVTLAGALKTLVNDLRAQTLSTALKTKPVLALGSTVQNVANIDFIFSIAGVDYIKAAIAAGTSPGTAVIPQSKFGAVAFDIGADLTIDVVGAPANGTTGYDSAVLASAALPAVAASHVRMGYVTISKSDGAFTLGTTALNAANSTVAYTDGSTANQALGAAVSASATAMPALTVS